MFKSEYAKLHSYHLKNKLQIEQLVRTGKQKLDILLQQELLLGGFESEFSIKRVPTVKFGQNQR